MDSPDQGASRAPLSDRGLPKPNDHRVLTSYSDHTAPSILAGSGAGLLWLSAATASTTDSPLCLIGGAW